MKVFALTISALVLSGLLANDIRADLPGPGPRHDYRKDISQQALSKQKTVPLVIEIDEKLSEARLFIPRKFIKDLRADSGAGKEHYAWAGSPAFQTVAIGLALSAALVIAGLFLTRFRIQAGMGKRLILPVSLILLCLASTLVWANMSISEAFSKSKQVNEPGPIKTLQGKVMILVVDRGDAILLVANPTLLTLVNPETGARPKNGKGN